MKYIRYIKATKDPKISDKTKCLQRKLNSLF